MQNGDVIIQANGKKVKKLADLKAVLTPDVKLVQCKVFRGYKQFDFTIELEK